MKLRANILLALALSIPSTAPPSFAAAIAQDKSTGGSSGNARAKSNARHSRQKNKAASSGEAGSAAQTDAQGNSNTLGVTDDARSRKNKTKVHRNVSGQGSNGSAPAPRGGQ
jgi:hypothetical protein